MVGYKTALDDDSGRELTALYLENAFKDLAELERLQGEAAADGGRWPDCCAQMRQIVHNVKGQGSSFGYPLMTRVGESCSKLLKAVAQPDAATFKLLAAHVQTLRTVLDQDIKGNGGELGETLASRLEALVDKLT